MKQREIEQLLAPLLLRPLRPAERRRIADTLEALARQQRELADAARRQQAKPAAARATPRAPQAGPGRTPSRFVRVERVLVGQQERLRLYVGRGIWYDLGSPARLDVQREGGRVLLRPASGDAGFAVVAGRGMPRLWCDGARDLIDLEDGRYQAELRGGAIVVGEPLT